MAELFLEAQPHYDGSLGWLEDALCVQTDPEAFHPEKGGSTREAKKVCMSCDVRPECLNYALGNDERFGVWGGMSERERRRLKKRAVQGAAESAMTDVEISVAEAIPQSQES